MNKSLWIRILALVLVVCMLVPTVSAAFGGKTDQNTGYLGFVKNIFDWLANLINRIFGTSSEPSASEALVMQPIETLPAEKAPTQSTEPVATEVKETEAEETEVEETESKETEAEETEPKETEPKETEPKETEPKETEPKETEPKETEPKETEPKETEPKETEPKETEPKETEPEYSELIETDSQESYILNLMEDEDTVDNGNMLRASTFALSPVGHRKAGNLTDYIELIDDTTEAAENTTVLKYFPVTMFNYDETTINAATMALEENDTIHRGLYFTGGSPEYEKSASADFSNFVAGEYYIQNIRASENNVDSWLQAHQDHKIYAVAEENRTPWTLEIENGQYYLKCNLNGTDYYMVVGTNGDNDGYTTTKTPITLSPYSHNADGVQLSQNGYYLCQWGSGDAVDYGGYNVKNDGGNGMRFYKAEDGTLVKPIDTEIVLTSGYEEWNRWDKASGNNDNGQKFYTGLVNSTLDSSNNIQFNVPDGGIFNSDSTVKDIYTRVQMPFVYKNGYYTFNAAENGVYFKEDPDQGSTLPNAETPRLYFDKDTPQRNGGNYGDGSTTVWMPFNNTAAIGSVNNCDYHFGMVAAIPFGMNPNGRTNPAVNESDPITFRFSGDDDVWVFIDNQLVIDLGGIHNRLDVEIDFAANTVTYSESNSLDVATGSYNNPDFALKQTLFGGVINKDITTFSAEGEHTLTVYYLERGAGASNCLIEFNLPMKDNVTVTKVANQSWSETENVISDLPASMQAIVDNIDFGFTLYKSVDNGANFAAVTSTNYYLLDADGKVEKIASTDASGHFTLRNGQTAKFITDFPNDGVCYYVVEDDMSDSGFVTPDYNFSGRASNGFEYGEKLTEGKTDVLYGRDIPEQVLAVDSKENKSYEIAVYGSDESSDNLSFVCHNYLNNELPNPSVRPAEDRIVIDYGLPVEIDVLRNDIAYADDYELVAVSGEGMVIRSTEDVDGNITEVPVVDTTGAKELKYGTVEIVEGKLVYRLNKQMTGVEVLEYAVQSHGTRTIVVGEEEIETNVYETMKAKVYISPATTMYYEENFSDLVTYTGSCWGETEGTADTDFQEHGRVGESDNSPYGSDRAYLNDSGDSNGTSRYADTTNSTVKFEYTFTGTGTSFFARTTNNTGYMYVTLVGVDNKESYNLFRDTRYLPDSASTPLYNIPVYTQDELPYGTYKVTCYVYKAFNNNNEKFYGNDFWLDGIRIMQPLDKYDGNAAVALESYAKDGEANMENVTLRNKLIRELEIKQKLDEEGNPVYQTDYHGNIVYQTDANGEQILDEEGNPIPVPVLVPVWNKDAGFVLFTDSNGEMKTADEYESIGPKEEVYLKPGQSVRFSLKYWVADSFKIYMGMKAPFGDGATVTVGNTSVTLNNTVDCYYDISKYAVISEAVDEDGQPYYVATFNFIAEDNIVSLTNIKVTGIYEFTIIKYQDENVDVVVNGEDEYVEEGGE